MIRISNVVLVCILLTSCVKEKKTALSGEGSDLKVGVATPVTTLKKHIADTFRLNLADGAFVHGYADQKSVDVVVEIYAPDKTKLESFDTPARGHEPFHFTTTAAGVYRVVVAPFEDGMGDYALILRAAEPVATDIDGATRQIIEPSIDTETPGPGFSVAVQKDGQIVYSQGFGYANLEDSIRNSPTTIFHIASVSKQFTSFAIAMLVDQGKLSLNDDIRKYLPELHNFGDVITINHLVHHTSGLRDQWSLLMMAGWRLDDVITRNQILRLVSRQTELNFKPGAEYLYCNTGFTLMAEIVSRVTHQSFASWTHDNIFEPLGMKNTLFYDDHEKIVKHRAYSYHVSPDGFKKSVLSYANVGATSLFTTVEDISLWALNFEKVKVGNANVMKMMNQRFVLNNGDTITYAFGQVIEKYKGLTSYSHSGGDAGFRTFLLRFPEQHFSVAVFSNLASFGPVNIGYKLADLYLAKDFLPQKELPKPQRSPEEKGPPFDPRRVKTSEYTGQFYSDELETTYTLDVINDTLTAHHQRHDDLKLLPVRAEVFQTRILGDVEFVRNASKKIVGFKATDGRARNVKFVKN